MYGYGEIDVIMLLLEKKGFKVRYIGEFIGNILMLPSVIFMLLMLLSGLFVDYIEVLVVFIFLFWWVKSISVDNVTSCSHTFVEYNCFGWCTIA